MSASRRNSKDLAGQKVDPESVAMAEVAANPTIGAISFAPIQEDIPSSSSVEKTEVVRDRTKSRELAKKMGGGKKGLWGKPEDLITTPPIDRDDPNFDSEEENDDIILVGSAARSPTLSPRTRSLSKIALVDGNPRAFGNAVVPTEVKKQMEEIISEYFTSGEIEEVQRRLDELAKTTEESYNYEFVKRAITMSMDKHEKERESVSRLLSELYLNGLTPLEIAQGFRRVLITSDDLALDIPTAVNMLSIFAARAVVDEIVPPKFLEDSFLVKNAEPVVAEAIKKLSIKHGTVRMEKGWGPGDGRPVEELKVAIDQLTKEFLLSRDLDEAATCVRELNVEHFHHEVVKRGIVNSFEEGPDACNAMSSLLAFLVSQDIVSTIQVLKGFERVKLALSDIKLDVPAAEDLFNSIVSRSISDGILPASFHAKNTFEQEGLSIDDNGDIISSLPKEREEFRATDEDARTKRVEVKQNGKPRQHASTWTRRLEKLDPLPSSPSLSSATKLLGRMSWDPKVLEIKDTNRRGDEPLPKEYLSHSITGIRTVDFTKPDSFEESLKKLPSTHSVREIIKQNEIPFQPRIALNATYSPESPLARMAKMDDRTLGRLMSKESGLLSMENHDEEDLLEALESSASDSNLNGKLSKENQKKYFGGPAKHNFYVNYRQLAAKQQLYRQSNSTEKTSSSPDTTGNEDTATLSPRTLCLTKSILANRPAIPLIIRKNTTNSFDFSYQSLGDTYIMQFAECVKSLPFLEEISVRDNRLSDEGLDSLLSAVHQHLRLRKLDISENEIGSKSAQTLRVMIASPKCSLIYLIMEKADIDDFECAAFMSAFEKNKSVQELYMPRNRIGEAEQLNAVKPEITTGGEAIASMLYVNEKVVKLDLSWNLLRLESGITLARSLEYNRKLIELNVAYNACGDAGAMVFGRVLTLNSTLRTLNLSYNNVGCRGALVIASAASKSKSLRLIQLNGNNIGREGGRALMFAMCNNKSEHGCDIEISGCNLASTGSSGKDKMFDPTDPAGEYSLDLSNPFDQMIATELLRLATFKKGCRFEKLKHHSRAERVKAKATTITLIASSTTTVFNSPLDVFYRSLRQKQKKSKEFKIDSTALLPVFHGLSMNPTVATLEAILSRMKEAWTSTTNLDEFEFSNMFFHALFSVIDSDQSGGIDAHELKSALGMLGIHMNDQDVANAIAQYDLDNSGTIEDTEFVEFIKSHVRRQSVDNKDAEFALRDAATNQVWQIPQEGRLEIVFVYEREATLESEDARHRLSDAGVAQLIKNIRLQAKSPAEKLELLNIAIRESEILFTAPQAYELLDQCGGLTKDVRVKEIANLALQMLTAREAQRLVSMTLSLRERAKLKIELGNAYTVIMGNPTAHFALDLSNRTDRWVACKLVEIAQAEKKGSIASQRGDTSQHGNWENYRNEVLDGEKIVLTTSFFNSLPHTGRLEFDYVSTSRPPKYIQALSDRRYNQLLKELARDTYFIDIAEKDILSPAQRRWQKLREFVRKERFYNAAKFAQEHIFRIKNSREEIRLKLIQIETATCDRYLTAAQASRIVLSMPANNNGRVEVARVLFSRLIDVENFVDIFDQLTLGEQKTLANMLGWLNVLNPNKPDRFYELDLSVLEDYAVAKILIRLAVVEEGDNWVEYTYSPNPNEPPLPDWILPASWDADDTGKGEGPRRAGILRLRFRSTAEDGCFPDWDARAEMKKRVLCGP